MACNFCWDAAPYSASSTSNAVRVPRAEAGHSLAINGLYGEAPSEMGTLFGLEVYKRVGTSRAEVQKRDGKTDV